MLNKTFIPFPILTTGRLTLRKLDTTDEQAIFTLRSDKKINEFLDRKPADNRDDARNFINTVNENVDKNASIYWAITFIGTNELVGTVCLFGFSDETGKCEIGYELLTQFQRQGIMQEAVDKVIDYAFNTIGVIEIEACFHRDNDRSTKLLKKFSFSNSDTSDNSDPDILCYSLKSTARGRT